MKKIIFLVSIFFSLFLQNSQVFANETSDFLRNFGNREAEWVVSQQTQEGAYLMAKPGYDGKGKIVPYFSNFAASGLLELNASKYRESVKLYLQWYFDHLNTTANDLLDATVFDYEYDINTKTEKSLNVYDSVDSYASTFVALLWDYYNYTGDRSFFLEDGIKEKILRIAKNINESTRDPATGLSFAKKDYHIAYAMDNIESLYGFEAAKKIFEEIYRDTENAEFYASEVDRLKKIIPQYLYDDTKELFVTHYGFAGTNLTQWYPDALVQLFPAVFDMEHPKNSFFYERFQRQFPEWTLSKHAGWVTPGVNDLRFPQAFILIAALKAWDFENTLEFLKNSYQKFSLENNPYPWNVSESGFTLKAIVQCQKNFDCRNALLP